MALFVRRAIKREVHAGWPTVSRDVMIHSRAAEELREELLLYLEGVASGRSVLVSGHRGAGKTMMVESVVDLVRRDIFLAIEEDKAVPARRPVLVRLHGPSLLGAGPTAAAAAEGAGVTQVKSGGDGVAGASPSDGGRGGDPIQSALEQITIALYRAVASEFTQGVLTAVELAVKEREDRGSVAGDLLELPARLRLETDGGADPGSLRDVLSRIDEHFTSAQTREVTSLRLQLNQQIGPDRPGLSRLETGVLWPIELPRSRRDLGFQEIVALATISHAFQVCIGKVASSEKHSDSLSLEQKGSLTLAFGLQDAAQKLFALFAGAAVGVGVSRDAGLAMGALAGLAAAVTATASLTWSSTRNRKGDRSVEYTFLPDHSVQTLDRDLPQIIDRLREVGLAPVFVVDEIDKVDTPDELIRALMRRLKQLTSDNGFFCFLTGRDYFDRVELLLKRSVYPIEHSYFTHRFLVAHRASDVATFLRKAIVIGDQPSSPPSILAALVLGRVVMHRSELNATSLVRTLSSFVGPDRLVREGEDRIRSFEMHRLEAILQLAIEHVTRRRDFSDRIDADERYVQIANDVFYLVSRSWRGGDRQVDASRESIANHLARRSGRAEVSEGETFTSDDLGALTLGLRALVDLLSDFEMLRKALEADPGLATDDRELLNVFSPPLLPLLRHESGDIYCFQWDSFGSLIPHALGEAPSDLPDRVTRIMDGLSSLALSLDDLSAAGLIPTTMTQTAVTEARAVLSTTPERDPRRSTAIERLRSFYQVVRERGPVLQAVLALVAHVYARCGQAGPVRGVGRPLPAQVLRALERYVDLSGIEGLSGGELRRSLQSQLEGADEVLSLLSLASEPAPDAPEWAAEVLAARDSVGSAQRHWASWRFWFPRVRDYFDGVSIGPARLVDIECAAMDVVPGSLFRRDLSKIDALGWSRIVLEALKGGGTQPWAVVAGLRTLGFGRDLLLVAIREMASLKRPAERIADETDEFMKQLATLAPAREKGLLQIVSNTEAPAGSLSDDDPPILRVYVDDVPAYAAALEVLQSWDTFSGVTDDGF